ncbi:rhodanese-like domain-containing protein [Rhodobacteraceae bacterium RKSG542]|uniref:rhodanese-like domain-containing protein n=1 Tax=Pseudovibrio flavus TaxID=2529854 RepID=UPI0012BD6ED5|nr:rhodanese-like domain-containing protein [Pseudovibrio flavus]MTI19250.1 rhodanese-like domain-containing protein [Pseudovibrio flavus]
MNFEQLKHYQAKLAFEMDSWDLYEAMERGDNFVVVDGRKEEAFGMERIPGAINLPHRDICTNSTAKLDKGKVYVCYCDGIGCNASTKTAMKLLTLGFEVKELIGGLDWWIRDGYATEGINARAGTEVNCGC